MLTKFTIKNYKSIKELEIKKLNRINLLVGRNNAGKSNVLEALLLYLTTISPASILKILDLRKDIHIERGISGRLKISSTNDAILPMVPNRSKEILRTQGIEFSGDKSTIVVRSFKAIKEDVDEGVAIKYEPFVDGEVLEDRENVKEIVRVTLQQNTNPVATLQQPLGLQRYMSNELVDSRCIYVNCTSRDSESAELLWNNIVLTPLKDEVIKALQLVSPNISDVAIIRDVNKDEALPYVRVNEDKIPLHSMGDGIAHIFNIMLALVNVKDGILLLDEMENGLHVRTLEKLWTIVNELSKQLNVQVFVTTHSNDCVKSFIENAREEGRLFRINYQDGETTYKSHGFKTIEKSLTAGIDLRDYTNAEISDEDDESSKN